MKKLYLFLVLASGAALAQTDNTFSVMQFPGNDIGTKTTAAQAACNPNTLIPCVIVFDPSLSVFASGTMPRKCPQCVWQDNRTSSGATNVPGVVNAALLPGTDIGAKINAFATANSASGHLYIPLGVYRFSTPISITQATAQHLEIECQNRGTTLAFNGRGDAIYVTSGTNVNATLRISNCTIDGGGAAAGANGVHAYDYQNLFMDNDVIQNFPGVNVLGEGMIDSVFLKDEFLVAGTYNLELKPDTKHSIGANGNRVYSGSMQYAGLANFFDAGNSSAYGGDTSNSLHGVTLEMNSNHPQFIIEGTWGDAIEDCYIEYIGYPTASGNLSSGYIGNYAGSGYGSNVARAAVATRIEGDYFITPAKKASYSTSTLQLNNSMYTTIATLTDQGAPTYGIIFYASGTNQYVSTSNINLLWQTAEYLNPPPYSNLWNINGQPLTANQYSWNAAGFQWGGSGTFGGNVTSGGIYYGRGSTTITTLATATVLAGSGSSTGLLRLRDNTNGGAALFMIDPKDGAVAIGTSQIGGTVSVTYSGGNWNVALVSGTVPRVISWTIYD